MSQISRESVLNALSTVKDIELNKDLVALNAIEDLEIYGNRLKLKIRLSTPAPSSRKAIDQAARKALLEVPGISEVDIKVVFEVPRGAGASGKQSIPGVKNIIAVSSGKGGVGKSTVAVNLAAALAQYGSQVGLLDTDVYGPNVPMMVGVDKEPEVIGQRLLPLEAYGMRIMSLGFLNRGDKPVVWRGPMLHTAVRQFLYDVEWGELDYLIVDMPPGTGDAQLSLAQLVPVQGAVLVTTPQEVAMADVRKAFNMFEQVHIPVLGIVENMSYFICSNCSAEHDIFGKGGGETLARRFNTRLLGQIPLSPSVRESGDLGVPVVIRAPESPHGAAFDKIATNVAAEISKAALKQSSPPVIDMSDNRGDSFVV